jgi:hypothetical protein
MNQEITQSKRFAQHVKFCAWYFDEIENITNDALLTDEQKLKALDELENKILTLAAPFMAVANTIKTKKERMTQ